MSPVAVVCSMPHGSTMPSRPCMTKGCRARPPPLPASAAHAQPPGRAHLLTSTGLDRKLLLMSATSTLPPTSGAPCAGWVAGGMLACVSGLPI